MPEIACATNEWCTNRNGFFQCKPASLAHLYWYAHTKHGLLTMFPKREKRAPKSRRTDTHMHAHTNLQACAHTRTCARKLFKAT